MHIVPGIAIYREIDSLTFQLRCLEMAHEVELRETGGAMRPNYDVRRVAWRARQLRDFKSAEEYK